MRFIWIGLLAFVTLQRANAAPLGSGCIAPPFAVKSESSKPITLSAYAGKVVLLNFWATWCAPCRVEMPWFEQFSRDYKERGLVVLGVSMDDEGWKVAKPALDKLKISYPVGLRNKRIGKAYGVTESLPVTFLIDRKGVIRNVKEGFGNRDEFTKEIEVLLQK